MIQKERSVFCEVIIKDIVRKKNRTNMCLVLSDYRDRAVFIRKYKIIVNGNKGKRNELGEFHPFTGYESPYGQ